MKDNKSLGDLWVKLGGSAMIFILVVIVILFFGAFYSIPKSHVGVKFTKVGGDRGFSPHELPQGFGLKKPFIDTVYDMPFSTQTVYFCGDEDCDYGKLTPKDKNGINFG